VEKIKNRLRNGTQEDQRVRLQEVVEGALQEALWQRATDQIGTSKWWLNHLKSHGRCLRKCLVGISWRSVVCDLRLHC
jgi:hypothetical protein